MWKGSAYLAFAIPGEIGFHFDQALLDDQEGIVWLSRNQLTGFDIDSIADKVNRVVVDIVQPLISENSGVNEVLITPDEMFILYEESRDKMAVFEEVYDSMEVAGVKLLTRSHHSVH